MAAYMTPQLKLDTVSGIQTVCFTCMPSRRLAGGGAAVVLTQLGHCVAAFIWS